LKKSRSSEHLDRIRQALEAHGDDGRNSSGRRGYLKQARRRLVESEARRQVVEHVRFRVIAGARKQEVAASLGLRPRTLRCWESLARKGALVPAPRGRPLKRSSVEARQRILGILQEHGPLVGVEMLWSRSAGMARGEIRDILRRYREHYLFEYELLYESLEWKQPGRVWAMDHTEPASPVDGEARAILSVRDLSSGAQILWKKEHGPRAADTVRDLQRCFEREGAPLVLKCDNGSAFIAEELRALCDTWGVELLWSPPRTPRYNGAVESGMRWMKERTEHVALSAGHPGEWRAEDLEMAKRLINELPRKAGPHAVARGEVYGSRTSITESERAAFRARLAEERAAERRLRGIGEGKVLKRNKETSITRQAMRRALVALGLLSIKARRVTPTLKRLRAANIS
jgi:hypothetical protein